MAHSVTIGSGKKAVQLPNGFAYDAGVTVILTDEQYAQIPAASFSSGLLVDNGQTSDTSDLVSAQGVHQAAPAALTSSAPAALTSAAATGGDAPTEAEYNALQADVAALRTTLAQAQVDVAALRTQQAALITALTGTGKSLASA